LDAFLAALFGGAVGWLIATIAFERARGHGAPTVWSIGAAGVGGIVAVLLSWRRSHR
jgi:hypothetical protein